MPELADKVDEITWIGLGQFGHLLSAFKSRDVRYALMAGAITKPKMFAGVQPDLKGLEVIGKLLILHDDDILRAVAGELEKEGINVLPASTAGLIALIDRHKKEPLANDRFVIILTGKKS